MIRPRHDATESSISKAWSAAHIEAHFPSSWLEKCLLVFAGTVAVGVLVLGLACAWFWSTFLGGN